MNQITSTELKKTIVPFGLLYLLAFVEFKLLGSTMLIYGIPLFSSVGVFAVTRRSHWYLTLPFSRKKLVMLLMAQNLIALLGCLGISSAFLFFTGKLSTWEVGYTSFSVFLLYIYITTFFMLSLSFAPRNLNELRMRKDFKYKLFAAMVTGVFLAWYLEIYEEPWIYPAIAILMFLGSLSWYLKSFAMPSATLRMILSIFYSLTIGLFFLTIGIIIYTMNFSSPSSADNASRLLGRLPSFISEERAQFLFERSEIGDAPAMEKFVPYLRNQFSREVWAARTKKCKSESCHDLSSHVGFDETLSPEESKERFLILLESCVLVSGSYGVECKGSFLSKENQDKWFDVLEKNGVLKDWLSDSDARKQVFALKRLPLKLDPEMMNQIEKLQFSQDPFVRDTALQHLAKSKAILAQNIDCLKDSDQHLCRSWRRSQYL